MTEWRSQNVPVGEPMAVLADSRFIGWALGARNALRAHKFTKSAVTPRTLWPSWSEATGQLASALVSMIDRDDGPFAGVREPRRPNPSLWPEGIYQPITNFEGPSLSERCKGSTHPDDAGALD